MAPAPIRSPSCLWLKGSGSGWVQDPAAGGDKVQPLLKFPYVLKQRIPVDLKPPGLGFRVCEKQCLAAYLLL